ncbi:MAG: phenylalanine--tRNA ligase subunit beta [Candidatus Babeliales bacterium]
MKLSLRWIFDHLDVNLEQFSITTIIDILNKSTAEIEHVECIQINPEDWLCVCIQEKKDNVLHVYHAAKDNYYTLPWRDDAVVGNWYLATKPVASPTTSWATAAAIGGSKDFLLPALYAENDTYTMEGWKNDFEQKDYIIHIDNKTITHRPDLWSHRGFARELSILLNCSLNPLNDYLALVDIKTHAKQDSLSYFSQSFTFTLPEQKGCSRIAFLPHHVKAGHASVLWMMQRLVKIDSRSINALIDCTNYVMYDIGQPLHAFDADKLTTPSLYPNYAHDGDILPLLDGTSVTLTAQDLVITDGTQPASLAGIMGGSKSEIDTTTKKVIIESAAFDAQTIRVSSMHHKKRTEASSRFEKSLDPMYNIIALQRFLYLARQVKLVEQEDTCIISLGPSLPTPAPIIIHHEYIEQKLGISLTSSFIITLLEQLECSVIEEPAHTYKVTVPGFRATKDLLAKEDLVEEIGRFYGYNIIPPQLPQITHNHPSLQEKRSFTSTVKTVLAFGCSMNEVEHYPFYDEEFLRILEWHDTDQALSLESQLSENNKYLVTSLVPHLIKSVALNSNDADELRFFEWNTLWKKNKNASPHYQENKELSGIIFTKKGSLFYEGKALLAHLFDALHVQPNWEQITDPTYPWFAPYQSAHLSINNSTIGTAGTVNPLFLQRVVKTGTAFIFTLNTDRLCHELPRQAKRYKKLDDGLYMMRDISFFIDPKHTVSFLEGHIKKQDQRIIAVTVLDDTYTHDTSLPQRSLTLRLTFFDKTRTITKIELAHFITSITDSLKPLGAEIR